MLPNRLSLKFFLDAPSEPQLQPFTPVFQRWIQGAAVEGTLIDVADYKHVPSGPGVILIGYEIDYALDLINGRPGLLVTRKRNLTGDLSERLRDLWRPALSAARLLQSERSLDGLQFDFREAELAFLDRLNAPNEPSAAERLSPKIQRVIADLYEASPIVERVSADPRDALRLSVRVNEAPQIDRVLERLQQRAASVV